MGQVEGELLVGEGKDLRRPHPPEIDFEEKFAMKLSTPTPKFNMEPENVSLEKEKHLKKHQFWGFHVKLQGRSFNFFTSSQPFYAY